MPDAYESVRQLPFPAVATALGIDMTRFTRRPKDWQGYCPVHGSKGNNNCFAYQHETGMFHCFSCNAKGRGAIDLTKLVKAVNFTAAVEILRSVAPEPSQAKKPRTGASSASGDT